MTQWKNASSGDLKRYQIIARMLECCPKLIDFIFHPSKPELAAPAEKLTQNPFSAGEKILIRAAIDFWNGDGHLELMELRRLDRANELRVIQAYFDIQKI